MEYEVGSLANLISGSPSKLLKTKLSEEGIKIKYKAVEKPANKKTDSVSGKILFPKKRKNDDSPACQVIKKRKEHDKVTDVNFTKPVNMINAEKRLKKKIKKEVKKKIKKEVKENISAVDVTNKESEIFVGNLPNKINKKQLRKIFSKYGAIESVRFRCPPLSDPRIPKRTAVIKQKFHSDRSNIHGFVRFKNTESAKKAVELNGHVYLDHHLRVDLVTNSHQQDPRRAVFVGNVPFSAEEDELWKMFEPCGSILSIRIVRDKWTGVGKGFAYINFESADAVELALKLNGEEMKKRNIRVERCATKKVLKTERSKLVSPKPRHPKIVNPKPEHPELVIPKPEHPKLVIPKLQHSKIVKREEPDCVTSKPKKPKRKNPDMVNMSKDESDQDTNESYEDLEVGSDSQGSKTANPPPKGGFLLRPSFQGKRVGRSKFDKKKKKTGVGELKKKAMIRKVLPVSKPAMKKTKKPKKLKKKVKLLLKK